MWVILIDIGIRFLNHDGRLCQDLITLELRDAITARDRSQLGRVDLARTDWCRSS